MKLTPGYARLAKKLKDAQILRGTNMEMVDLRMVGGLVTKGLAKKEPDHKDALKLNAAWMFKYTATPSLMELSL